MSSIEHENDRDEDKLKLIVEYRKKIETELTSICTNILDIIHEKLIPNSKFEESKVFYYKMKVLFVKLIKIEH